MALNFLNDAHLKTAKFIGIGISSMMLIQRIVIALTMIPAGIVMYKIISGLLTDPLYLEQRLMTFPGISASLLSLTVFVFGALRFHTASEAAGFAKWLRDPAGVKADLEGIFDIISRRDSLTAETKDQVFSKAAEFFSVEKYSMSTLKSKLKMLSSGKAQIEEFSESLSGRHQTLVGGFTSTLDTISSQFLILTSPMLGFMLLAYTAM